jgi:uncharacterized iron-regulated protein
MNCRSAVTWLLVAALQGACAHRAPAGAAFEDLLPTPLLMLGEQHDSPEHQRLQRETLRQLVARGLAAAVVLEMAERGRHTTGLAPNASEAQVREALDWTAEPNAGAWSWGVYGPLVMDAVRAGVPVLGGNLPRAQMRKAMRDAGLDATLTPQSLERQRENIREGHCGLLPESQIAPMARIQVARDRSLAETAQDALRPSQTVLLVAGNQHVRRDLGVPLHLPMSLGAKVIGSQPLGAEALPPASADRIWFTPARPPRDHCADLEQQMKR